MGRDRRKVEKGFWARLEPRESFYVFGSMFTLIMLHLVALNFH